MVPRTQALHPSDNLNLPGGGGRGARHRWSDSGRTCRRRRGTTSPLRDRGVLPRLARQEGCVDARRYPLRYGPASQSRHPRAVPGGTQVTTVDRPLGPRIKLDWTTRAASSRPHPNGPRRVMPEHDRVGSRPMDIRGYVPVEPATQCEGTCARDCNYLISAAVTKPGPTAHREILPLPRTDSIKAQRG